MSGLSQWQEELLCGLNRGEDQNKITKSIWWNEGGVVSAGIMGMLPGVHEDD